VRIKHRLGENSIKMYDNIKPCPGESLEHHAVWRMTVSR
jgi:hypothetical protein